MADNVHIVRVHDNSTDIRSNIEQYQSVIDTTNNRYVFADPTHITVCSAGWKYAISDGTVTYLDEWFNDVHLAGSVYLANYIYGNGDEDTYIHRTADKWDFQAGGISFLEMVEDTQSYFAVNVSGGDIDWREYDAAGNVLLWGDAGDSRIGIGIATPDSKVHIWNASAGTIAATTGTLLTLENNDSCYLSFLTPADKDAGIMWGDPDDEDVFTTVYNHNTNKLEIGVDGNWIHSISSQFDIGGATTGFKDGGCVLNVGVGYTGAAKADLSQISIINLSGMNVADNDGTSASILWKQFYYDASTPDTFDSGRIRFGTEQDTTATATTQDSFFAVDVSENGSLIERIRVTSSGAVILSAIKSGATQVASGAVAGELWKTASHATLPDNVVMIGV